MTSNFQRLYRLAMAVSMAGLLAACAHPISMEPKQLPDRVQQNLVPKKVGYVITDADRAREVTTPGGGGDKISYFPYRDMEKALRASLLSVYQDVQALGNPLDMAALQTAGVSYVFTPQITTNSSSPSPFTWPPTRFNVEVTCRVTDAGGKLIGTVRATGDGAAEFEEFKSDFSLSARRAAADVAIKLAQEIRRNEALR